MEHPIPLLSADGRGAGALPRLATANCNARDVQILKGVVSKDHIHFHVSYPPAWSISDLVRRLKGRSAKLLLQEVAELERRDWGGHFWGIGYGAWSVGNITEEVLEAYLNQHKEQPNGNENFILE